uniref:delta(24)-sterol reductase-like isoform X1 n=2 Tax=Styela clava TaxID=7725 RepID=UPI001939E4B7|nr:delta(24)-sterol reductase-like isoform X1 [Styela clava]
MDFTTKVKKWIISWLEEHRGLVIVLFCLPASFLFDSIFKLQRLVHQKLFYAPENHDTRVKSIQKKVRHWNELPVANRIRMCTARPNWLSLSTTFFRKNECYQVSIPLYDILDLDKERMIVRVEPMVSVGEITEYLIPLGYTLAVTLEISDATCGGLAVAVGMTTYSHRVGLYQEAIESFDIVLADGSLVRATRDDHSDLFQCLPWSHGTLGFLVALELRIVPVKPYVHMKYISVKGQKEYCDKMREFSGAHDKDAKLPDYLEATVFSKNQAVIMVGNFAECDSPEKRRKINHVSRWYKPWFYKHVETFLNKTHNEEYIPLREYLLRHNRAIFWVLESMIPFGNNPIFRLFLGWLCPPKPAFLKFTTTPGIRAMTFVKQVFQDIVLPMTVLEESINKAEELFDTYPVLIYPCTIYNHGKHSGQLRPPRPEQMCPGTDYGMFYDLGVYGTPGKVKRKEGYDAVYAMRSMERFIIDSGGYSFLYADIFMKTDEFEEMFDLTLYRSCRKKYGTENAFPNLYDKVKPEVDVFSIGKQYAENN